MCFVVLHILKYKSKVGHSTGWPCVGDDLINDGKAVVDFIKTKYGVPEENILLHGN